MPDIRGNPTRACHKGRVPVSCHGVGPQGRFRFPLRDRPSTDLFVRHIWCSGTVYPHIWYLPASEFWFDNPLLVV